jgi:hypothetical protein
MYRLKQVSSLLPKCAADLQCSRLGIGFEKLDRDAFDPEKAYDKLAAVGVKWIRIQSGWAKTEKQEGVYDFLWLDKIVDNLLRRGLEPWICLCYGNPVYTELAKPTFGAVGCIPTGSRRELDAWERYVRATVAHFRDRVEYYEIWNEPDCFYAWRHSEGEARTQERHLENATEYGEFAILTSRAVKSVFSGAKVIGFAFGHVDDLEWANRVLSTGLAEHIDYASFHCYSPDEGKRRERALGFRRLLDVYRPGIGLIQGETGAQSRSDGRGAMAGFAWTPERQTKALLRGLVTDLALGVHFTSYFSTMDMIEALAGRLSDKASYLDYGYFGLLGCEFDENGVASGEYYEKPAYYAYGALVSLLHGACSEPIAYRRLVLPSLRVNGEDSRDSRVTVEGFRLADGGRALLYWNAVDLLTETYEGTISLELYGLSCQKVRLVDLRDGGIYALPDGMCEEIGAGALRLSNLPLTDSPLVLLLDAKRGDV